MSSEERVPIPAPVVEPTPDGALTLGRVYWREVERFTRGVVRAREDGGGGVELTLLGNGLILFGPAETRVRGDLLVCRYPIRGGLLVRRPGGSISFAQHGGPRPEIRSTVAGFHPRLAARPGLPGWTGWLYERVQARLHGAVGRSYVERLVRGELE